MDKNNELQKEKFREFAILKLGFIPVCFTPALTGDKYAFTKTQACFECWMEATRLAESSNVVGIKKVG